VFKSRIAALTVRELLLLPVPDTHFLVDGLLPHPAITALCGPPGSLKTWLTCGLGLALAGATPFLGHGVPEPRRALLLEGEMPPAQIARRLRLLGSDPACEQFSVFAEPLDLYDDGILDDLLSRPESVIILDSAIRFLRGSENTAEDAAAFYARLYRLRAAGKSVVLLRHVRKRLRDGNGPVVDSDEAGRGSSEWQAGCDAEILVRDISLNFIEVRFSKARDFVEPGAFAVRLVEEHGRASLRVESLSAAILDEPSPRDRALHAMLPVLPDAAPGMTVKEVRSALIAHGDVRGVGAVRRALADLTAAGSVLCGDDGTSTRYWRTVLGAPAPATQTKLSAAEPPLRYARPYNGEVRHE